LLAMQVASGVKKLKEFCNLVEESPSDVCDTLDEIEVLSVVVEKIEAIAGS